jgi:hypothetical protein
MRAFVAAVMRGDHPPARPPPAHLIERNHLGPIAFRLGDGRFRGEYAASSIMAARRAGLLAEMTAALVARGVRVALVKGIAYAGTIYPDPAERPMHDIDLLVPRRDFPEAMRCMAALEFARIGRIRRRSRYYHAIELARDGLRIELHRSMVQHYRTSVRMGDVWRRARPDPGAGGAERLDPVDDLLLCMLHIARHELAVPALNYVDVSRLWDRLDAGARDELAGRATEYRVARAVSAVRSMTELLAEGRPGRPAIRGGSLLPSSDEVLAMEPQVRLRQIGRKLVLSEGIREALGLGLAWGTVLVDGWRRDRPV